MAEATWMTAQNEDTAAFEAARQASEAMQAAHQAQARVFQDVQPAGGGSSDVLAGQ
jgi:hypothetical protein